MQLIRTNLKLKLHRNKFNATQQNTYFRAVLVRLAIADSRIIVPSSRTGTSSEICNDNLQVTVISHFVDFKTFEFQKTKNKVL